MKKRLGLLLAVVALLLCGCLSRTEPVETTQPSSHTAVTLPPETTRPVTEETEITPTETETTETPSVETQPILPPDLENEDFVRITDVIPNAREALAYATEDNFTGVKIYDFTDAYLRYGTLLKLRSAAIQLEILGYGIVIWDAYRPVYAQERLWDAYPNAAYVSPPGTGTQSHCRGCAVDITLYDLETGELLEMPTGFDDFSGYADRDYSDVSEEAAANARMLEEIMAEWGFKPYKAEWWHFTDTDSYEIEYEFDPAMLQ